MDNYTTESLKKKKMMCISCVLIAIALITIFITCVYVGNLSPKNFPINLDIKVTEGLSQSDIVDSLESSHVIKSSLLLHVALTCFYKDKYVLAGTYRFPYDLTTREVARALTAGEYKSPAFTLVLPEGFSTRDFSKFLPDEYIYDNADLYTFEGTLFPDTYYISNDVSVTELVELLQKTMNEKLLPYENAIKESGFTRDEVLVLASILEREANDETSMKYVSGILQNRLKINMPLQVDATLDYILDKTSAELTQEDLELDSAYNTYVNTGLPPKPISNPGIMAIEAVLNPKITDYMYYLTGNDGKFYYAETFEQHKQNKARYLR
jgi:UPF0755 protein